VLPLLNRLKGDEALMLAYKRGDAGAFEILYQRHKDGLFAFLFRSHPRRAVVEELAQDTWVAVINAATHYTPKAKFRTWLFQIAHNKLVDHWRRPDNHHTNYDTSAEVADSHNSKADTAEISDIKSKVLSAIGALPRDQKDALLLSEQGFSNADIANITGVGKETVKSRLRYARNQLRDQLGEFQ
jgi:RNA polymerase sigma factor (sigma-70 family)